VVKEFRRYVQPFRHNTGLWQTDRQTDRHLSTANTALMYSIVRLKIEKGSTSIAFLQK